MADVDDKDTLFKDLPKVEDLPEDVQKIVKSFQADYTRKTQAAADVRKQAEDELARIKDERQTFSDQLKEMGALQQEVTQWRDWHKSLEELDDKDEPAPKDLDKLEGNEQTKALMDALKGIDTKIAALNDDILKTQDSVKSTRTSTARMFKNMAELGELVKKDPEIDENALLKHTVDKGFSSLTDAYENLYRDKIIEREVAKQVEEQVKQRMDEIRTTGVGSKGPSRQVIVTPHKDKPKTFMEATQQSLDEHYAKGGT